MKQNFSPEQISSFEESRRLSDEELLKNGAYYLDRGPEESPQLILTEGQIADAKQEMSREILKTSFGTCQELGEYSDIPFAKELSSGLNLEEEERIKSGMPFLVELRYKCSDRLLRQLIEERGIKQVVELASGFMPHALNLAEDYPDLKYIEVDYGARIKEKIAQTIKPDIDRISYIEGNLLAEKTQNEIQTKLSSGPVAIFSEGLMMYLSEEDRAKLGSFVKEILTQHGGVFFFEDNTTFNPDFRQRIGPIIAQLHKKLASAGKTSTHQKSWTQQQVTQEFETMGFDIERMAERDVTLSLDKYPYRDPTKDPAIQEQEADEGKKLTREEMEKIITDAEETFRMWVLRLKK